MAKFLVENGADINAKDSKGRTALVRAALYGNEKYGKIFD